MLIIWNAPNKMHQTATKSARGEEPITLMSSHWVFFTSVLSFIFHIFLTHLHPSVFGASVSTEIHKFGRKNTSNHIIIIYLLLFHLVSRRECLMKGFFFLWETIKGKFFASIPWLVNIENFLNWKKLWDSQEYDTEKLKLQSQVHDLIKWFKRTELKKIWFPIERSSHI